MKDFVESENKIIKNLITQGSEDFQKLEARIDQESNDLKKLQDRLDKEIEDLSLKLTDILKQAQTESQALKGKLSEDEISRQQKEREISVIKSEQKKPGTLPKIGH